jgi:GNAT superfamily N-acetyltransferase
MNMGTFAASRALIYSGWPMQLRTATAADAPAIAALHAASWRYAYRGTMSDDYLAGDVVSERLAVWTGRLNAPSSRQYVVIAESNDRAVGFACAYACEHPQWGSLLDNIHVDRSCSRTGIGTKLMQNVGSWCTRSAPTIPLYLWVLEINAEAQAFYKKLGATNVGRDLWDPPGGGSVPRRRFAWNDPSVLTRV